MKKLYRSKNNRRISGVCGGLGEVFGVDPNVFRLGSVLVALATGIIPVLITYIGARIILPEGNQEQRQGH